MSLSTATQLAPAALSAPPLAPTFAPGASRDARAKLAGAYLGAVQNFTGWSSNDEEKAAWRAASEMFRAAVQYVAPVALVAEPADSVVVLDEGFGAADRCLELADEQPFRSDEEPGPAPVAPPVLRSLRGGKAALAKVVAEGRKPRALPALTALQGITLAWVAGVLLDPPAGEWLEGARLRSLEVRGLLDQDAAGAWGITRQGVDELYTLEAQGALPAFIDRAGEVIAEQLARREAPVVVPAATTEGYTVRPCALERGCWVAVCRCGAVCGNERHTSAQAADDHAWMVALWSPKVGCRACAAKGGAL